MKKISPTKAEIALMEPFVGLELSCIHVPTSKDEFASAMDEIMAAGIVGFDTESKPTFAVGEASEGPHVVQFALHDRAYLFQLHQAEGLPFLTELLQSEQLVKVGFGLKSDSAHVYAKLGIRLGAVVDLNTVFSMEGYQKHMGVRTAVGLVFKQRFAKSRRVTTSNWSQHQLTSQQLLYAANDAYAALKVLEALGLPREALPIMETHRDLNNLQPQCVWAHFATLCEIPRSSLHEAALIEHLIAWAEARGISATVDGAGNLILGKPASPGCEGSPGVILQGHLDMVCQANAGTVHDFERDPICTVVRDGWLIAQDTTLGADNGIGVALALAALEEPNLPHPPLEVLLTVNEESGMDGARGLAPGTLQGKVLINLDTEEWGHFYLGCAGGVDVEVRLRDGGAEPSGAGAGASHLLPQSAGCAGNVLEVRHDYAQDNLPPDFVILRFDVSGLRGGHSGIDIHLGRGNAIKLLAEALRDLATHTDMRLIEMQGGTARNAIPREAYALCALPAAAALNIDEWVQHRHEAWRERFAQADAGVLFRCELDEMAVSKAIPQAERDRVLAFLDNAVNGVAQVSDDFPGVSDTSSNLGVFLLRQGEVKATFKVRSLHDARADALADKLISFAASYDLHAWKDGAYPGWTPNPLSDLLALCQQVYAEQFGSPAGLQVIHAGLECGLLAASHPHLDMISFGPDIRGAHAPGERVKVESVAHCWTLLKAVLAALARE